MQIFKSRRKEKIFNVLLFLYLFYYSYRYILQYNSSTTSPTYRDTPVAFQLGKYIFLAIIIFILLIQSKCRIHLGADHRINHSIIAILFLIFQFLTCGILTKNMDAIAFSMILMPSFIFLARKKHINIEHIEKMMLTFWWFSLLYELIQIALYIRSGRLPALAYPTGKITDVRFGGAWDDPNGYALLMIFYLFWFLFRYKRLKQIAYLGATVLMLVLTWSGTAFVALAATALIILLIRLRDRMLLKRYLYYGLVFIIFVGAVFLMRRDTIMETLGYFFQSKSESVAQHQSGWELSNISLLTIIGLKPDYMLAESGYIRMLSVGGIPALIAFFIITNAGCKQIKNYLNHQHPMKPFLYGMMAYLIGFVLSNVNLPHITSFSCMGIFGCFIILIYVIGTVPYYQKATSFVE